MNERILRTAILKCEEDYADDRALETAQSQAIEVATEMGVPLTPDERKLLTTLARWAESAKNRTDSKADAILAWLDEHLKTDGKPNDKRVILFTEYRATHSWLQQILVSHGWGGDKLLMIDGSTEPEDRETIKAAFQAEPSEAPVRILLATDAASEGIDLQRHCNYMIHIEIPWNPNVMEQRNGRIDRHGQKEKQVHIWHPVGSIENSDAGSNVSPGDLNGDLEFLFRAVEKVQAMREDLGSVGPVIAQQIEEAMLGRRRSLDTRAAERQASEANKLVGAERKLKERVAKLHERLLTARDSQRLDAHRIERAVSVALELAGKAPMTPVRSGEESTGSLWELPILTGSWAQALEGLTHPHTGKRRPITFDHETAIGRDDVVLAHLGHRLVQMALRLLRAEVWAPSDRRRLHRVAVRSLPAGTVTNPIIVVWSRLVVTGGGHNQLHEELTMASGELKDNSFARIRSLSQVEEMLDVSKGIEPTEGEFRFLQSQFALHKDKVLRAVEARSKERLSFLQNTLNRRREAEEKDLQSVLDDLEKLIRSELAAQNDPEQGLLWAPDKREELKHDTPALKARLSRIPEEREAELRAIQERYREPEARTFPVAIEFLVPADQLRAGA